MSLSPPVLPLSKNDLLPCLTRHHVDLRSHFWIQYCLGEDLNVSSKAFTKPRIAFSKTCHWTLSCSKSFPPGRRRRKSALTHPWMRDSPWVRYWSRPKNWC